MEEKGYAFTPSAFLLMIPVIIVAIAFTGIVNDLNNIAQLAIGGDVTYTAAQNIIVAVEKGAQDSGRNAAYNATRVVIDNEAMRMNNPFFNNGVLPPSKTFIANRIADGINSNVVNTSLKLESETGRDIFINNVKIDSYNDAPFNASQISITQTEPFSYNVNIPQGMTITVAQKGQNSTLNVPSNSIKVKVSIEGLEDPYVWVKSKDRRSDNIYQYPYYSYIPNLNQKEYHFDDNVQGNTIQNLQMCLNGTNNPSGITPRPYYFPDSSGPTFFDRLEGKNVCSDSSAGMATFILGNPLYEDPGYHGTYNMSCVDHEYFTQVNGTNTIKVNGNVIIDPWNSYYAGPPVPFCLSTNYRQNVFNLKLTYP